MAIQLEFIDFVVPISIIKEKYPGGWEGCLRDHASSIGGCVWFDKNLFRDGAMNPNDIEPLVKKWNEFGFETMSPRNGEQIWKEVCVVESMFVGSTLPCDWLTVNREHGAFPIAFLTGTKPGAIVGREAVEKIGIKERRKQREHFEQEIERLREHEVSCPKCGIKHRLPVGISGTVRCVECSHRFHATT